MERQHVARPPLGEIRLVLNLLIYGTIAAVILAALYWISLRARTPADTETLLKNAKSEDLLPKHYRFFPQVSRALSGEDMEYLTRRTDGHARSAARRARRGVGLEFLQGLREDYRRLNRLARALTALAPSANVQRESERVWLELRFKFVWYFVWLCLWTGMTPIIQIRRLADLIGGSTARLETAINVWQETSLSVPSARFSA